MKVLGIHIATGQLRFSVLEGTKTSPSLIAKDKLTTLTPQQVPALMDWFDTQFGMMLDQHSPDKIAYRLTLAPKKPQLFTSIFPFGILNLKSNQRGIPIECYVSGNYVASKLGLPKTTDIYAHCDTVFGDNPPYWDKNQKHSVLAAWFELP
jgi:hypothetical protein